MILTFALAALPASSVPALPMVPPLARVEAKAPVARTPEARTPEARTPDARTPDARTPEALRSVLEASRRDHRPVVLRVKGQDIAAVVVRLQEAAVEVRRQDHSRLLLRLDRIETAALR